MAVLGMSVGLPIALKENLELFENPEAPWMGNSRFGDIPDWECKTGGMPDVISILPLLADNNLTRFNLHATIIITSIQRNKSDLRVLQILEIEHSIYVVKHFKLDNLMNQ